MTKTQIYLPADLLQQAKVKAKSLGVKNLSQYIRDLLRQSLVEANSSKPKLRITKLNSKKTVYISQKHNDIYEHKLRKN